MLSHNLISFFFQIFFFFYNFFLLCHINVKVRDNIVFPSFYLCAAIYYKTSHIIDVIITLTFFWQIGANDTIARQRKVKPKSNVSLIDMFLFGFSVLSTMKVNLFLSSVRYS